MLLARVALKRNVMGSATGTDLVMADGPDDEESELGYRISVVCQMLDP